MNYIISRFFPSIFLIIFSCLILSIPQEAIAYGGPGSVVSGIGALLAAGAALLAALFGFVWFPLKRLISALKGDDARESEPTDRTE